MAKAIKIVHPVHVMSAGGQCSVEHIPLHRPWPCKI